MKVSGIFTCLLTPYPSPELTCVQPWGTLKDHRLDELRTQALTFQRNGQFQEEKLFKWYCQSKSFQDHRKVSWCYADFLASPGPAASESLQRVFRGQYLFIMWICRKGHPFSHFFLLFTKYPSASEELNAKLKAKKEKVKVYYPNFYQILES